jgi:hypothetical protein
MTAFWLWQPFHTTLGPMLSTLQGARKFTTNIMANYQVYDQYYGYITNPGPGTAEASEPAAASADTEPSTELAKRRSKSSSGPKKVYLVHLFFSVAVKPGRGRTGSEGAGRGRKGPVGAVQGAGTCANPKRLGTPESQAYPTYR